jgi:hypothetical protein
MFASTSNRNRTMRTDASRAVPCAAWRIAAVRSSDEVAIAYGSAVAPVTTPASSGPKIGTSGSAGSPGARRRRARCASSASSGSCSASAGITIARRGRPSGAGGSGVRAISSGLS